MNKNNLPKIKSSEFTSGFSFIELMVVVGIISFLAIVAIFVYPSQLVKARDARRKTDLSNLKVLTEEYEKDNNCYPATASWPACGNTSGTIFENYAGSTPCDPQSGNSYVYEAEAVACPSYYHIYTNLENEGDPDNRTAECEEYGSTCGPPPGYNYFVESPNAPLPI